MKPLCVGSPSSTVGASSFPSLMWRCSPARCVVPLQRRSWPLFSVEAHTNIRNAPFQRTPHIGCPTPAETPRGQHERIVARLPISKKVLGVDEHTGSTKSSLRQNAHVHVRLALVPVWIVVERLRSGEVDLEPRSCDILLLPHSDHTRLVSWSERCRAPQAGFGVLLGGMHERVGSS